MTGLATLTKSTFLAKSGTHTFDGGLTLNGGILAGATSDIDVNGDVTLTKGIFTAPDATGSLLVSGN